jgi:thiamine biosynthesis lipoprotein
MTTAAPDRVQLPASAHFRAIGTRVELHVTDTGSLASALWIARELLDDLDAVASRFRIDSEVCAIARIDHGPRTSTAISPTLADHVRAAVHAAMLTGGLVDPTVGHAVESSGYDADIDLVQRRTTATDGWFARVPGWQSLRVDSNAGWLELPRGTLLDLGATAKAHAADVIARELTSTLSGGFLVNLGGDIAVSGEVPEGGWSVGVERADGTVTQTIALTDQAVATSSTQLRTWHVGHELRHHIVDPRTGRTAPSVWAQVTCVGATALEANAASTAAVILGEDAPAWLTAHGVAARLDRPDGSAVRTAGWPAFADTTRELASKGASS